MARTLSEPGKVTLLLVTPIAISDNVLKRSGNGRSNLHVYKGIMRTFGEKDRRIENDSASIDKARNTYGKSWSGCASSQRPGRQKQEPPG